MKVYRNIHDTRMTAEKGHAWLTHYLLLNENRTVIATQIPQDQIECSASWKLEEDTDKTHTDEDLRKAALDILSRIFHYGDMKIETPAERTLCGILHDLGLFPTTGDSIITRPEHQDLFEKYKNFTLPK